MCTPSLLQPLLERETDWLLLSHLPQLGANHTMQECTSDPWGSLLLFVLSPYSSFEGFQQRHRRPGLGSGLQRWTSPRLAVKSAMPGLAMWAMMGGLWTQKLVCREGTISERPRASKKQRIQCSTAPISSEAWLHFLQISIIIPCNLSCLDPWNHITLALVLSLLCQVWGAIQ